jgi:hypothetical protein
VGTYLGFERTEGLVNETEMLPRFGNRRWIAWKLVQLAARIYDAEFYERIVIRDSDGDDVLEFTVTSDLYGCGVSSSIGHDEFGGYTVTWEEFTPDWLEEL